MELFNLFNVFQVAISVGISVGIPRKMVAPIASCFYLKANPAVQWYCYITFVHEMFTHFIRAKCSKCNAVVPTELIPHCASGSK